MDQDKDDRASVVKPGGRYLQSIRKHCADDSVGSDRGCESADESFRGAGRSGLYGQLSFE